MIRTIEIETIDYCNAKCIMCPKKYMYNTGTELSIKNTIKIAKDIKNCVGEFIRDPIFIILSLQNEPLLDPRLLEKAKIFKENLNCSIHIYTNGVMIDKRLDSLKSDLAIDEIIISNYGDTLERYNMVTEMELSEKKFIRMKNAINDLKNHKNVRIWNAWQGEKLNQFTTRAGQVSMLELKKKVGGCKWGRPYNYLTIRSNGDLILCCQDHKNETKYGNIIDNDLEHILKSDQYDDMMQKAMGKKESDLIFICKRCNLNMEEE